MAEGGEEPIVPFVLRIAKDGVVLVRSCPVPVRGTPSVRHRVRARIPRSTPSQIADATGIHDVQQRLDERVARLEEDKEKDPTRLDSIERRIVLLKEVDRSEQRVAARFFGVMMPYFVPLAGKGSVEDPNGRLDERIDLNQPWLADFWMGRWDPDAMCAFMQGYVSIPTQ